MKRAAVMMAMREMKIMTVSVIAKKIMITMIVAAKTVIMKKKSIQEQRRRVTLLPAQ